MYGRAIIAKGDPARMEEFETFVRDRVDPAVRALAGNAGMSMFANPETGEVIVVSAWIDEKSLADSRAALGDLRDEGLALIGATESRIETVEPVLMEQKAPDQPGYWTRSVESATPPEAMAEAEEAFRRDVLPVVRGFDGVNTISLLADRTNGKHVVNVTYVSRAALEAAREQGQALRDSFLSAGGRRLTAMMEVEVRIVGMAAPPELPTQTSASDRSTTSAR